MFNKMKEKERTKLAKILILVPWALFLLTSLLMIPVRAELDALGRGDRAGLMVIPVAHAATNIAMHNIFASPEGTFVFMLGMFVMLLQGASLLAVLICTPIGLYTLATSGDDEKPHQSDKKS